MATDTTRAQRNAPPPPRFIRAGGCRDGRLPPASLSLLLDGCARPDDVDERKLTPAEAATALQRPVFWPGRAVEGVELAQIELMRLTTTWTDGRVTEGRVVVFRYGVDRRTAHLEGKPSLMITEGTSTEEVLRGDFGGPRPGPGELRLKGVGRTSSGDAEMWFGSMQRDGVYISFESPQRDLILAAAKAMVRLG